MRFSSAVTGVLTGPLKAQSGSGCLASSAESGSGSGGSFGGVAALAAATRGPIARTLERAAAGARTALCAWAVLWACGWAAAALAFFWAQSLFMMLITESSAVAGDAAAMATRPHAAATNTRDHDFGKSNAMGFDTATPPPDFQTATSKT